MKIFKKANLTVITTALLGVFTILVIGLQIYFQNQETTKLETTLFNILQFLLSLAFSVLLTKMTLKDEFQKSQKKFAISAFRRINEINMGLERLISRVRNQTKGATKETFQELEVINALALSVRGNIKSSIADWADIIGEEIELVQKIESLEGSNEVLLEIPESQSETRKPQIDNAPILKQLEENNAQIDKLMKNLPASLKITTQQTQKKSNSISGIVSRLIKQKKDYGELFFDGFWDPSFPKNITELAIGSRLYVSIGDVGSRVAILMFKTDKNEPVGVLTNGSANKYFEWSEALFQLFGKSTLSTQLVKVSRRLKNDDEARYYFQVKALDAFDEIYQGDE